MKRDTSGGRARTSGGICTEVVLAMALWPKTECPYCGVYVRVLATHRCSTERALDPPPVVVDREPVGHLNRWREKLM